MTDISFIRDACFTRQYLLHHIDMRECDCTAETACAAAVALAERLVAAVEEEAS